MYPVLVFVNKIFTFSCRSSRLALAESPPVFAVSTAFLYIPRRVSSTDTTLLFDVDWTCFISICLSGCSVSLSISPVISFNSSYFDI